MNMADTILFLAHAEAGGTLAKHALETLATAASLGGTLVVGIAGSQASQAAASIGGCGAARFLIVEGEAFDVPRYSTDAAAAEALARASGATVVVAPGTSRWSRAMGGVAQRLNGRIDTHVTSLTAQLEASRWYYRQRIEAVLTRTARPWFLLLESGSAPACPGPPAPVTVEKVEVEARTRTEVAGVQAPKSDQQTIRPDARLLFVAGAGWTKKQKDGLAHVAEAGERILTFLGLTQSSLGSSKSLVDLSGEGEAVLPFLSHLNQVGQTGATPRHPKGLAACCHGEEPHVVGWRFVKERRAINLDANCGWARGKADVVYVADAFAVIARINELLQEKARAAGA